MNTSINARGELNPSTMARVYACAIIFLGSMRYARIAERAEKNKRCIGAESVAYTLAALKRLKKQGLAGNYVGALDILEREQVGDRGSRILDYMTYRPDDDATRINKINQACETQETLGTANDRGRGCDYLLSIDNGKTFMPHYPKTRREGKEQNKRSIGAVMNTLYTQWESREANADPWQIVVNGYDQQADQIAGNLRRWYAEYADNQSKTVKARLLELADSEISASYLMSSNKAGKDKDIAIRRLANSARRLYERFPYRTVITGIQFVNQIRAYMRRGD